MSNLQTKCDEFRKKHGCHPTRKHLSKYDCKIVDKDVYFITDGEFVKIGVANNIENRKATLQTGNPKKLRIATWIEYGGEKMEKELHEKFSTSRVNGEWFKLNKDLCEFIKDIIYINYRVYGQIRSEVTRVL